MSHNHTASLARSPYARGMAKRELSEREFTNLHGAYPTLTFDADQWGEHGFFYDPVDHQFGVYAIDRKEQTDEVETVGTAAELFARCSGDHRAELQTWLDSFQR